MLPHHENRIQGATSISAKGRPYLGYNPAYTRTDLTDDLHAVCGFRTDYEIISDINMKKVIRESRKR